MTDIDIHALVAMSGAGDAAREIRKTIDPYYGIGTGEDKNFTVLVQYSGTTEIKVKARCKKEASEKALAKSWSGNVPYFDQEIYDVSEDIS